MVRISAMLLIAVVFVSGSAMAEANTVLLAGDRKAAMSGECSFDMSDAFKGRLAIDPIWPPTEQHAFYLADFSKGNSHQNLHIDFGCEVARDVQDAEHICKEMTGFVQNQGTWMPARLISQKQAARSSAGNPTLIKLDKGDIRGALYVSSDTDGPKRYQLRTLQFCLVNRRATLWGGAVVDGAPYSPRYSTENEAIQLIKSIDFAGAGK